MHKFPKILDRKWKRYDKIEKIFILYLIFLLVLEIFLPFIKIESSIYSFINLKFFVSSFILFATLLFLIIWNSSYRFKTIVKSIFGFEQNEAILNFGVLFVHTIVLIYTKEFVSLLAVSKSSEYYTLTYGFYVLGVLFILGMLWNLFLAIKLSINTTKRSNYTKVIGNPVVEEKKETNIDVKTLF